MKLLYTPIAGYVHTCEAVVNYASLRDRVEPVAIRPYESDTPLAAVNPLGKVPTLQLPGDEYLAGGPVIYEYLDSLHDQVPLYPNDASRWQAIRQAWLADGLFDTLVLLIVESWLDREEQRTSSNDRLVPRIGRILEVMDSDVRGFAKRHIGWFRFVGALAFLDRVTVTLQEGLATESPELLDWRANTPGLAAWHDEAALASEFTNPLIPEEPDN